MKNKAEKYLDDWSKEYEDSLGEVCAPALSNASYISEGIPFYAFDDGSLIIKVADGIKIMYEAYDNIDCLEMDYDKREFSVNGIDYEIVE